MLPEIERQQAQGKEVTFRSDAAFAKPQLYEALGQRDVQYAIRLPANNNLQGNITELLTRPVERPSHKPVIRYKSFLYEAASWDDSPAGGGESRVPLQGVISPRRLHRDQSGTSSRAVVRF